MKGVIINITRGGATITTMMKIGCKICVTYCVTGDDGGYDDDGNKVVNYM